MHFIAFPLDSYKKKPGEVEFSKFGWQTREKKENDNVMTFFCLSCDVCFAHGIIRIDHLLVASEAGLQATDFPANGLQMFISTLGSSKVGAGVTVLELSF